MLPTVSPPNVQLAPPTQAATVNAAVSVERQTHKHMHVGVDSSQKDQKADNDKPRGDQKEGFATQKAEGELGAVRRKNQRGQQNTQQQFQQNKQAAPSPEKPSHSATLSYADKLSALAGMNKTMRGSEKKSDHLETIAPHLARHGDGSVTAGLATSRLLSDLDELMGEDIYANSPALTSIEGSGYYHKAVSMHDALTPSSIETDIQS